MRSKVNSSIHEALNDSLQEYCSIYCTDCDWLCFTTTHDNGCILVHGRNFAGVASSSFHKI